MGCVVMILEHVICSIRDATAGLSFQTDGLFWRSIKTQAEVRSFCSFIHREQNSNCRRCTGHQRRVFAFRQLTFLKVRKVIVVADQGSRELLKMLSLRAAGRTPTQILLYRIPLDGPLQWVSFTHWAVRGTRLLLNRSRLQF